MSQKTAADQFSAWDAAWPLAAGAGIGAGARLLRQAWDLKTKGGVREAKPVKPVTSANIQVPVEISPEEADELKAKGIKVAAALQRQSSGGPNGAPGGAGISKGAPAAPPPPVRPLIPAPKPTNSTSLPTPGGVTMKTAVEGFVGNLAQGALGAGAIYGGWSMLDNYLDKQRVDKAKASLERSRGRVSRLLAGQPEEEEIGVHKAIKTAEDAFVKLSWSPVGDVMRAGADILSPLGIPLGIGATMLAAKTFQESKANNKYRQRIKQISDALEHEDPAPPVAVLTPRLRAAAPKVEDDEDKKRPGATLIPGQAAELPKTGIG